MTPVLNLSPYLISTADRRAIRADRARAAKQAAATALHNRFVRDPLVASTTGRAA